MSPLQKGWSVVLVPGAQFRTCGRWCRKLSRLEGGGKQNMGEKGTERRVTYSWANTEMEVREVPPTFPNVYDFADLNYTIYKYKCTSLK